MALIDQLRTFAGRIPSQLEHITTEEATKNALILPFLNALGYNVFDPAEVVPEFTADVGIKKGEKVDYAVKREGQDDPIMIFECKAANVSLDQHSSQLFRYFGTLKETRIAVLTNGLDYRFFADLEVPNRMDESPFLEFNILEVTEQVAAELEKLAKAEFNLGTLLDTASDLKHLNDIIKYLNQQFAEPSEDFVRHFTGKVYKGRTTQHVLEEFTGLVKKGLDQVVRERVGARLKSALAAETASPTPKAAGEKTEETAAATEEVDEGVETTEQELQAYYIVKAIAGQAVDLNRIFMRDQKTYFTVILDDNNRKPICRLHSGARKMHLGLFDAEKNETRHEINNVGEIYRFADELVATAKRYEEST